MSGSQTLYWLEFGDEGPREAWIMDMRMLNISAEGGVLKAVLKVVLVNQPPNHAKFKYRGVR